MTLRGGYLQIADDLRRQLDNGEIQAGSPLPSEHALARRYGVSRGTARAALALLSAAGLVEVVPGQGRRATGAPAAPVVTTAWEQVAQDIRNRLKAGHARDAPLPSEAQLSAAYHVSRNTVRRAYRQLVEEGVVVIRQGAGAFPAD